MRILVLCLWCLLAFQGVLAEEKIAKTTVENNQFQKQDSGFIEVDFPALFEEYKTNKAEMTKFAFKAWWKKVNDTLEGAYVRGTAIVKNVKDGWTGLHIKMGTKNDSDTISITLYLDKDDETEVQTALALKPGKLLTFTGKLDEIMAIWGAVTIVFNQGAISHDIKIVKDKVSNDRLEQQEKDSEKLAPKNERPEKEEVVSTLSFREIRKNMKNMTDVQFEEYAKSLKGKRIRWKGYVEDVKEKFFGGYKVLVDMDSPNEPISVQDITFEVSKEQAISLTKDDKIQFEGTISSVLSIFTSLQVSLDKANVVK